MSIEPNQYRYRYNSFKFIQNNFNKYHQTTYLVVAHNKFKYEKEKKQRLDHPDYY